MADIADFVRFGEDGVSVITWSVVCNTSVTNWNKSTKLIVSAWFRDSDHTPSNIAIKLRWRNLTDNPTGSFIDLTTSGELQRGVSGGAITNTDPVGSSAACGTPVDSQSEEIENESPLLSGTFSGHAKNDYIETQWCIDMSNAHDSDEYQFELYNDTASSQIDILPNTVTIAAGPVPVSFDLNSAVRFKGPISFDKNSDVRFLDIFSFDKNAAIRFKGPIFFDLNAAVRFFGQVFFDLNSDVRFAAAGWTDSFDLNSDVRFKGFVSFDLNAAVRFKGPVFFDKNAAVRFLDTFSFDLNSGVRFLIHGYFDLNSGVKFIYGEILDLTNIKVSYEKYPNINVKYEKNPNIDISYSKNNEIKAKHSKVGIKRGLTYYHSYKGKFTRGFWLILKK